MTDSDATADSDGLEWQARLSRLKQRAVRRKRRIGTQLVVAAILAPLAFGVGICLFAVGFNSDQPPDGNLAAWIMASFIVAGLCAGSLPFLLLRRRKHDDRFLVVEPSIAEFSNRRFRLIDGDRACVRIGGLNGCLSLLPVLLGAACLAGAWSAFGLDFWQRGNSNKAATPGQVAAGLALFGTVFVTVGLVPVPFASRFDFNRRKGRVRIWSWFSHCDIPLAMIQSVEDEHRGNHCRFVNLRLTQAETHRVHVLSWNPDPAKPDEAGPAASLGDFLGVPVVDLKPSE